MIDKKLLRNFDYPLLVIVILIAIMGLIVITSATQYNATGDPYYFTFRQGMFLIAGLLLLLAIVSIDYYSILRIAKPLYFLNLILLSAVFLPYIGRTSGGAQRWISLGFIDLQPAEFAKLIIIITLAKYLVDREEHIKAFYDLSIPLLHVAIPMGLIFLQPDLGTAMVFGAIFLGILFFYKVKFRYIGGIIGLGLLLLIPLWFILQEYQRQRLIAFLNPTDIDPLGTGFQLWHSLVAIGSGGTTGKGLFQGTQNQLDFLPEAHTDFIFSVIGEELGFVGAVILIVLYLLMIYRILKIAFISKDLYGTVICGAVATMFLFQLVINVGMTIGLMPLTGLPLPFISYGGSSLITSMLAIGLVLNVGMRRHKILF